MATLSQALALILGQPQPPWSTSSLRATFKSKSLSLGSVLKAVDNQVILLFIEIRPSSLLNGNPNLEEFLERWVAAVQADSQAQIINTARDSFGSFGVSVAYISKDLRTIGVIGTFSSLLRIDVTKGWLNDPNSSPGGQHQSGMGNLGQGIAAAGASFAALSAAEGASSFLAGALLVFGGYLGFIAAGVFIGVALYQLLAGAQTPTDPSQVTTTDQQTQSNQPTQSESFTITPDSAGLVPDNLQQDAVDQLLAYFNTYGVFPPLEPGQIVDDNPYGDDGDDGDDGGDSGG